MLKANGSAQAHQGLADRAIVTRIDASLHDFENILSPEKGLQSSGGIVADY